MAKVLRYDGWSTRATRASDQHRKNCNVLVILSVLISEQGLTIFDVMILSIHCIWQLI
jgi:hypothetical protein